MKTYSRKTVSSTMLPPPPMVPSNNAAQSVKPKRVPMLRPGYGSAGRPIDLLSNHFKASFTDMGLKTHFFRYNVLIRFENGRPVEGRGILGRKVLEKVWETYWEKLLRKPFVFDGVNGLYTVGPLPQNRLCFTVGLPAHHSNKTSIGRNGAREGDCKRQRMDRPKTFKVEICFSTKIPINALHQHDPAMSEEALKVLDIILRQHTTKQGSLLLSQSLFQNKSQNGESGGGPSGRGFHTSFQETQIGLTLNLDVYKAVVLKHGPLLDFILESQNVKTMQDIDWEHALKSEDYNVNPMMHACGITISPGFAQLNGRVLQPPKLRVGNGREIIPQRGRWCLNNERVYEPAKIKRWAIVNFSATKKSFQVCEQFMKCAKQKGLLVDPLLKIFEEESHWTKCSFTVRVDQMFQQMRKALSDNPPEFVLCILAKKTNDNIYGPWKKRCVVEHGIVTQCLALPKLNDSSYMTNLVLDINAKLGGLNFVVPIECLPLISQVSEVPTMILGLDITRGGTHQPNMPFFATVVGSRQWPSMSRYRATVRVQSPKSQMIDFLFNPQPANEDKGIIWELFQEFYTSSGGRKPEQIFIFRSGAHDSQFDQVLNIELDQIIQACRFQSRFEKLPKFTVIVAQKKHWTKFFLKSSSYNVPPGTVVDTGVCHPRCNDFYMCSHAGIIGTSRPTHYHVLLDEIGFSADALQELVLALSHSYQRSTTAVSIVAPLYYANLAATHVSQFIRSSDESEFPSSHSRSASSGGITVPELPSIHPKLRNMTFFY